MLHVVVQSVVWRALPNAIATDLVPAETYRARRDEDEVLAAGTATVKSTAAGADPGPLVGTVAGGPAAGSTELLLPPPPPPHAAGTSARRHRQSLNAFERARIVKFLILDESHRACDSRSWGSAPRHQRKQGPSTRRR